MGRMPNGDLTPYDTGERAQPLVWVSADSRRPAEDERDRYGKVDFEDDGGETLATVHVERVEACHVLVVYSAKTNTEARINLDADLGIYDVSEPEPTPPTTTHRSSGHDFGRMAELDEHSHDL